jgi:two-component system, NtrC family, response regulator AtoC
MSLAVERMSESTAPEVRVLVVDDDAMLVRALQRVLALQGFTVDAALDGQSALGRLRSTAYDVMLLDLRMGTMDGMEVFRVAHESDAPPATILHSAFVDVGTAVQAIRSGVCEVMEKPVPEHRLTARILELAAERRSAMRPGASPEAPHERDALERLVGESRSMQDLRDSVRRVARFPELAVLVQGPTGTGKELVAEAIHAVTCPEEPFVSVNCAAVPEHLFESELFGHEAGAFTNAKGARTGLLEEAGRGTIFLDEIGEMPFGLQAKLLRVLETREFRRVGANRSRPLAARVVSATNQRLTHDAGSPMRADLFFRLAGYTILTPPLSERLSDLPLLAQHFVDEFSKRHRMPHLVLAADALALLEAHPWPGNVRELRAVMENGSILARNGVVGRNELAAALGLHPSTPSGVPQHPSGCSAAARAGGGVALDPPATHRSAPVGSHPSGARSGVSAPIEGAQRSSVEGFASLPDLEKDLIIRAFEDSRRNLSRAARGLGIPRTTLRDRLRKYGIR